MNENLIRFLLERLDAVAAPVFGPADLPDIPRSAWIELERWKVLRRASEPESIERDGNLLAVRRCGDLIFGFDEDEEFPCPIALTEDDLVTYRLNLSGLLDELRDRNKIQGRDAASWHGFYQLGRRGFAQSGKVTIYLSLMNADPAETQRRLTFIAGQSGTNAVIFPVWPRFDTAPYIQQDLHIADLNPDLSINWPNELSSGADVLPYAFIEHGSTWTLRVDGVERTIDTSKGIKYIAFLVKYPGQVISAECVEKLELPADLDLSPATAAFGHYDNERDRGFSVMGESGPKIKAPDPEWVAKQRRLIASYEIEIEKAQEAGQMVEAKEFEEARDELEDEVNAASGERRATRPSPDGKVRTRVSKAIDRAYLEIKKKHPEAYNHLKPAISKGFTLMYKRPPEEAWQVEFL